MVKKSSASSRPARLKSRRSADIANSKWTESERQAVRRIAKRQAGKSPAGTKSAGIPLLTESQLAAMVRLRQPRLPKVAVSVRLDAEVLDWLKSKGTAHLTRINDILLNLMESERRAQ